MGNLPGPLNKSNVDIPSNSADLTNVYKRKIFDTQDSFSNLNSFLEVEYVVLEEKTIPRVESIKGEVANKYGTSDTRIIYKQTFTPRFNPLFHKLTAQYVIFLSQKTSINQITIVAHNFGENSYIKVNSLQLSDGDIGPIATFTPGQIISNSTSMHDNQYSRSIRWVFPIVEVQQITIELEQSYGYPMRYSLAAFCPYLEDTNNDIIEQTGLGVTLLDISDKILFQDIAKQLGSTALENIDAVNVNLDLSIATLDKYYTYFKNWSNGCPPHALCKPVPITGFHLNTEIGEGGIVDIPREESNRYRYAIGVSDISFGILNYKTYSVFVSKQFKVDNINEVSLEVEDFIPSEFGNGDWLKYYVSFDNGASFLQINPTNYSDKFFSDGLAIPKIIYCNSDIPEDYRSKTGVGIHAFYDSTTKIENIRLRVEISRPSDSLFKNFSPIVYSYNFRTKSYR